MHDNFTQCLAITLRYEGGDVHHSADPGGRTSRGVTQATYDAYRKKHKLAKRSVYDMSRAELETIYKAGYWDECDCDLLPKGVDLCVFDYGVNSGPQRASKAYDNLKGELSPIGEINAICDQRMAFLRRLKTWPHFGKGWTRRVEDCRKEALRMVAVVL